MDWPRTETLDLPGVSGTLILDLDQNARKAIVALSAHIRAIADQAVRRQPPGYCRLVPAAGGLLPHLTVQNNLVRSLAVGRRDILREHLEDEAIRILKQFDLQDVPDRFPNEITPGRRRVVGLARAILGSPRPSLIVCEDTSGLPAWGSLPNLITNTELASVPLLLLTDNRHRADCFDIVWERIPEHR